MPSMLTSDSCPWCHTPSIYGEMTCRRCGHHSGVPRPYCGCLACHAPRPLVAPATYDFDLPEYRPYLEVKRVPKAT